MLAAVWRHGAVRKGFGCRCRSAASGELDALLPEGLWGGSAGGWLALLQWVAGLSAAATLNIKVLVASFLLAR